MKKNYKRVLLLVGIISLNLFFIAHNNYVSGQVNSTSPSPTPTSIIEPLKLTSKPPPKYTNAARDNKMQGLVKLKVTFLETGKIGTVEVICGLPHGLNEEAIKAAQGITFEPAKKNGVPYTVTKEVQYNFKGDFGDTDLPNYPCDSSLGSQNKLKNEVIDKPSDEKLKNEPKETSANESLVDCQDALKIKLQGFRLGMSVNEVLKKLRISRSEIKPLLFEFENSSGEEVKANVGQAELQYIDHKNIYEGVFIFQFYFYEDKVSGISVLYDGTIEWDDIKEYSETLGKSLNLSSESWWYSEREIDDSRYYFKGKAFEGTYHLCSSVKLFTSLETHRPQSAVNPITKEKMYYTQLAVLRDDSVTSRMKNKAFELIERKNQEQKNELERKKKVFKP